jgi:thiamine biosynthesis lipoprotein
MNFLDIRLVRLTQNHMATTFDFRISCEAGQTALANRVLEACHLRVTELERELSEFLPESPVFKLNHSEAGIRIRFTAAGIELLERAENFRRLSVGAFNPYAKSRNAHPEKPSLRWERDTGDVWKESQGTWLGFGAIGKGYALDQASALVEKAGFENYLLSGGGSSIVLSGRESPSSPWRWGWSWKKTDSGANLGLPFVHSTGRKTALGISGTHEQGQHILGAKNLVKSSLIATPSAADADALSTALFVSGWEDAKEFLNGLPTPPASAWIDQDEVPHWNGLFQQFWGSVATAIAALLIWTPRARADETVDLSNLGDAAKTFTPYVFERNPWWVLLPIFCFLIVLVHLRKTKPKRDRPKLTEKLMKKNLTSTLSSVIVISLTWLNIETSRAATIEPLGKAVAALLGTTKAVSKTLKGGDADGKDATVFYTKGNNGAADKVVFIQHGLYKPDCTHTWAIGMNASKGTVSEVRVIEMACPHAFPTKSASFLDQYKGKGPADVATLDNDVHTIAKATGTSILATEAVKRSITTLAKYKGQL